MNRSRLKKRHAPFQTRTLRYKNPAMRFFCPLCSTERAMQADPHMSLKNYLQVGIISVVLMALTWSFMGPRSVFWFFPVWACFEVAFSLNFRKEVPCPHCGFDAGWYKKDVKVARQLVDEFWQRKEALAQATADSPVEAFQGQSVEFPAEPVESNPYLS